eukprot:Pgem_evm1s3530
MPDKQLPAKRFFKCLAQQMKKNQLIDPIAVRRGRRSSTLCANEVETVDSTPTKAYFGLIGATRKNNRVHVVQRRCKYPNSLFVLVLKRMVYGTARILSGNSFNSCLICVMLVI